MQSSTGNIASGVALALETAQASGGSRVGGGGGSIRGVRSPSRVGKMGDNCLSMPLNGRLAAHTCPISAIDRLKCQRTIVAFQLSNWRRYQT